MNYAYLRERLEDDQSKIYFDARFRYLFDKRVSSFYQTIRLSGEKYFLREIDLFKKLQGISSWIVFGNDDYAIYNCQIMMDCGYSVIGVTSNDLMKMFDETLKVYDVDEINIALQNGEIGLIVNQRDYALIKDRISYKEKIIIMPSHIVGRSGFQYFDFFSPHSKEVFLDAGSLDGKTTLSFIEWCNGDFERVYAFEPNPLMFEECRKNLNLYQNRVLLFKYALWDKPTKLLFENTNSKWDARIDSNGSIFVETESIDHILNDKKITFIKFDIEGSEMAALAGAQKSIMTNKPRMAISVYHKDNDLFDIMEFLINIIPDYKFAIRHYHSDCIETILYVYR